MSAPVQEYPDRIGFKPDQPRQFTPYIGSVTSLRELTPLPLIVGAVLGLIFGASSLYLVLKVGLTVSASIPVAVISITLFKLFARLGAREATILEHNVVQTAGSAGESIAFGVGVTMPAILILGFDLEITRVMLVAILGGLLGILMMIPLRRALIVAQHGILKYPEGPACAEVLKAGASPESRAAASEAAKREQEKLGAGTSAKTIFTGFGLALAYKTIMVAFRGWKEVPERIFGAPFRSASVAAEISPELLGVGYIIGPRIAAVMCAGGVLAYLVLIPMISFFGSGLAAPLSPETTTLIRDMSPGAIRDAYVLYIGAGCVAAGGLISVGRALPTIWHGIRGGMRDFSAAKAGTGAVTEVPRTDRDLPMRGVLIGIIALVVVIAFASPLYVGGTSAVTRVAAAFLIIVFGFLFVTVSSRLTGEIGSSSNPISGMTVATLLLTCLTFVILGWTGSNYFVTALSIGAIVCIAASNGGTTSQDLKTGFLVGATPRSQQIAILVGATVSALALGPILLQLNSAGSVYVPVGTQIGGQTAGSVQPGERANVTTLSRREGIEGTLAAGNADAREYLVWHRPDPAGGNAEKYLVDDAGTPVYFVDPGINGSIRELPGGQDVPKFDAPKATLMSYIIKGILGGELPWALVLLGAMIAIVLEMAGIPSLAFAVGVYLPLSSSSPILIGGLIRWLVDKWIARKHAGSNLTHDQLIAEGDKSPGVLMASGYIAGGAIAGIIIAFLAGVPGMAGFNQAVDAFAESNPARTGPMSDVLALVPFVLLITILYLTGREKLLAPKRR
jgi:putative OPT family oligopeptide transporter